MTRGWDERVWLGFTCPMQIQSNRVEHEQARVDHCTTNGGVFEDVDSRLVSIIHWRPIALPLMEKSNFETVILICIWQIYYRYRNRFYNLNPLLFKISSILMLLLLCIIFLNLYVTFIVQNFSLNNINSFVMKIQNVWFKWIYDCKYWNVNQC